MLTGDDARGGGLGRPPAARSAALVRRLAVQQVLPLEGPAGDAAPARQLLAEIASTAGTLERYAVHVADEAAAAGFTEQAFELGVVRTLAKRIGALCGALAAR